MLHCFAAVAEVVTQGDLLVLFAHTRLQVRDRAKF